MSIVQFSAAIPMIYGMESQQTILRGATIFRIPEHGRQKGFEIIKHLQRAAAKRTSMQLNDPEVGKSTQSLDEPVQRATTTTIKEKLHSQYAPDNRRGSEMMHELQEIINVDG